LVGKKYRNAFSHRRSSAIAQLPEILAAPSGLGIFANDASRSDARPPTPTWCCSAWPPTAAEEERRRQTALPTLAVTTRSDLNQAAAGLAVSVVTGAGLAALHQELGARVQARAAPPLAPSLRRCHGHVSACLALLRRAHEMVLFDESAELLAVELRDALEQLGAMVGAVYTEDLLDQIFSRFSFGK